MQPKILMWACLSALVAGCGSGSEPAVAEASRYDALAHEVAAATTTYCDARPWSGDGAACTAAVATHERAVAPHLDEMSNLAGYLDDHAHRAGRPEHADCACGIAELRSELERHRSAACSGTALALEAEALRHCEAMISFAATMHTRAGEVTHDADEWPWSHGPGSSSACSQATGHR